MPFVEQCHSAVPRKSKPNTTSSSDTPFVTLPKNCADCPVLQASKRSTDIIYFASRLEPANLKVKEYSFNDDFIWTPVKQEEIIIKKPINKNITIKKRLSKSF